MPILFRENWNSKTPVTDGWLDFSEHSSQNLVPWGGLSDPKGGSAYAYPGMGNSPCLCAFLDPANPDNPNGTIYTSHSFTGLGANDGAYYRWKAYWSSQFEWNTTTNKHLFIFMGTGPVNAQVQEMLIAFRPLHDDPSLNYLTGNVPVENIKYARPGIHQYASGNDAILRPEWAAMSAATGGDIWYLPNVPGHENFAVTSGRWYDFEVYIKPNPLGQSFGGVFQMWVDGILIADHKDISLRHAASDIFMDQIQPSSYWGGGGVYPAHPAQYVLYDNIIVSTTRVPPTETRYYICPLIGAGTSDDPIWPKIKLHKTVAGSAVISHGKNWAMVRVDAEDFSDIDADLECVDIFERLPGKIGVSRAQTLGWLMAHTVADVPVAMRLRIKNRMTTVGIDTTGITLATSLYEVLLLIYRGHSKGLLEHL